MTTTWNTSVYELINIFRGAMIALLPSIEKARIRWKQGEAYDDWDEIAEVLYRSIVERSLGYALGFELVEQKILPAYDSILPRYENEGRIEVESCVESGTCVFVRLSTSDEPFDTIDYIVVGEGGKPRGQSYAQIPLNDATLSFRNGNQVLDDISIEI